ncbi:MAG: hypothetical protein ACRC9P_02060 [Bacteroides sp.]
MSKSIKEQEARIYVKKSTRDEIKVLAAREKMTMYDFIEKIVKEYKVK